METEVYHKRVVYWNPMRCASRTDERGSLLITDTVKTVSARYYILYGGVGRSSPDSLPPLVEPFGVLSGEDNEELLLPRTVEEVN